jgi:hypothetical protein
MKKIIVGRFLAAALPQGCTGCWEFLPGNALRNEYFTIRHDGDTCPIHEAENPPTS